MSDESKPTGPTSALPHFDYGSVRVITMAEIRAKRGLSPDVAFLLSPISRPEDLSMTNPAPQDPPRRSPVLDDLTSSLRCSFETVQAVQRDLTNAKLVHGTGSDEHAAAVTRAEGYGPALVADYLTLQGDITRLERIVNAAVYLYDNRHGGPTPHASGVYWDELGRALGRDPAQFSDPPETCRNCNVTVPRLSEMLITVDGDPVCVDCADALGPADEEDFE